jgi:hypothetical protein
MLAAHDGVVVDGAGNVYVADMGNATIDKVDSTGNLTVVAGEIAQAGFQPPTGSGGRPYGVRVGRSADTEWRRTPRLGPSS